jgi:hypothetical protein
VGPGEAPPLKGDTTPQGESVDRHQHHHTVMAMVLREGSRMDTEIGLDHYYICHCLLDRKRGSTLAAGRQKGSVFI